VRQMQVRFQDTHGIGSILSEINATDFQRQTNLGPSFSERE
jgi:hypothetical protein